MKRATRITCAGLWLVNTWDGFVSNKAAGKAKHCPSSFVSLRVWRCFGSGAASSQALDSCSQPPGFFFLPQARDTPNPQIVPKRGNCRMSKKGRGYIAWSYDYDQAQESGKGGFASIVVGESRIDAYPAKDEPPSGRLWMQKGRVGARWEACHGKLAAFPLFVPLPHATRRQVETKAVGAAENHPAAGGRHRRF